MNGKQIPELSQAIAGRYAIYVRSPQRGSSEQSLPAAKRQRTTCLQHLRSQAIPREAIDLYEDREASGVNVDRPGLARLLAAVRARSVRSLLVYQGAALTTWYLDWVWLQEQLRHGGVAFEALREHISTASPEGERVIAFISSFAPLERTALGPVARLYGPSPNAMLLDDQSQPLTA